GASTSATERTDKFTSYGYKGSGYITDTESAMYKMLFGNNNDSMYWIASRGGTSLLDSVYFDVFVVVDGGVYGGLLFGGITVTLDDYSGNDRFAISVRPIVYLNSNIQTSEKDASGAWIISE
ncbi:MAG: hypothetical protein HFJ26_09095, partial [Clostridia bacterium]|nr:hypothetical protein [Clostridia bacterium]